MDLLLWRHAQAQKLTPELTDIDRELTGKGRKQALRMADWLNRQIPESTRIFSSPAKRCLETCAFLDRKFKVLDELAPNLPFDAVFQRVAWPRLAGTVLLIGHQPMLGQIIAHQLRLQENQCSVKKGALWWMRCDDPLAGAPIELVAIQAADML